MVGEHDDSYGIADPPLSFCSVSFPVTNVRILIALSQKSFGNGRWSVLKKGCQALSYAGSSQSSPILLFLPKLV